MATSHTTAQFSARIASIAKAVERTPQIQQRAISRQGTAILERQARAASGGDMRLSKVRKGGAPITVKTTIDNKAGSEVAVKFKALGPWPLVENVIKPHIITSKRFKAARGLGGRGNTVVAGGAKLKPGFVGRREAAIKTPWGYRMFARHPGIKTPKKPWAKGKAEVLAAAPRTARVALLNELRKA